MKRSGVVLRIITGVLAVLVLVGAFLHWRYYVPWNFPAELESKIESKEHTIHSNKCDDMPLNDISDELDRNPSGHIYMAPPDNIVEIVDALRSSDNPEDKKKLVGLESQMEAGKSILNDIDREHLPYYEPTIVGDVVNISFSACRDCYWRIRCLIDGEIIGWSERIDPLISHELSSSFIWDTTGYVTGVHWITLEFIPKWYYFPLSKWHSFDRIRRYEIDFTLYPKGTRRGEYGELVVPHD